VHSHDVGGHESPPAGVAAVLFDDYSKVWIGVLTDLAERTVELY
jgi:hypothetical protein